MKNPPKIPMLALSIFIEVTGPDSTLCCFALFSGSKSKSGIHDHRDFLGITKLKTLNLRKNLYEAFV